MIGVARIDGEANESRAVAPELLPGTSSVGRLIRLKSGIEGTDRDVVVRAEAYR